MNIKNIYDLSIIGSVGIPANYGGFETLVEQLIIQNNNNLKICVFCSSKKILNKKDEKIDKLCKRIFINLSANGISGIIYDIISIIYSLFIAKNLLILGTGSSIILPLIELFKTKKIFIYNLDGLEYKRKKWGFFGKNYLRFTEYLTLKYSDKVVIDNIYLKNYINNKYKNKYSNKLFYISYGGDHVLKIKDNIHCDPILRDIDTFKEINIFKEKYYLSIARAEPENNFDLILNAFLEEESKLIIISNWDKSKEYTKYLLALKNNSKNIFLVKAIYDLNKIFQIRKQCICYIHGHSVGGTNPSLVEALAINQTIFSYDVGFNRSTLKNFGEYWKKTDDLKNLIKNYERGKTNSSSVLNKYNNFKGNLPNKKLIKQFYNWEKIYNEYCSLIKDNF